jgi:hypothetical protein
MWNGKSLPNEKHAWLGGWKLRTGATGGLLLLIVAALLVHFAGPLAPTFTLPAATRDDPTIPFFERGEIPQLRLLVEGAELEKLRHEPRKYVRAQLVENGTVRYTSIGVKLKGAAGSFRDVDDRPALTLSVDKHTKGQTFHGLKKFHLNNSVQDESLLHEWLCAELARSLGVPATRVTHARVWLNDRDLGLYVLKEGFDKAFLSRHYATKDGNFYDGGFVQEIDAPLEKDSGDGRDDRSDLQALVAACREEDLVRRQQLLGERLEIDSFLRFVAFELITCHWDGYCRNRNNYRIYFAADTGRAHFLPHGMDQMFNDPGHGLFDVPDALVCQGVLTIPEFQARYDRTAREAAAQLVKVEPWLAKLDVVQARLQPVLAAMSADAARHQQERAQGFKQQLAERARHLAEQLRGQPAPLDFSQPDGVLLTDWQPQAETPDATLDPAAMADGRESLRIKAGPGGSCIASWRTRVQLPPGKYRWSAQLRTLGVEPLANDPKRGAGVRISGGDRTQGIVGSGPWQAVSHDFEVGGEGGEVVLVAELRATVGEAWFERESLRLVKLNP